MTIRKIESVVVEKPVYAPDVLWRQPGCSIKRTGALNVKKICDRLPHTYLADAKRFKKRLQCKFVVGISYGN